MKTKVLWVEDSARLELRNLMAPIYVSGEYDLNLAEDATSAVRFLQHRNYDVVILDSRIPPGMNDFWVNIYRDRGEDKADARLGLELAKWLLDGHLIEYPFPRPIWITSHQVAVFTVENDSSLHTLLGELGIKVYQHKTAGLEDTILISIIKRILNQR